VGYAFYNLGRNSLYYEEKITYFAKTIEYLEKDLYNNNYLNCLLMAKIYAQ
jgi:hypothetical protein